MSDRYVMVDEIREVSGFSRKSKLVEWLKARRISYVTNAYGHPIVLRSHWDEVFGGTKPKEAATQPNWEGMFKQPNKS